VPEKICVILNRAAGKGILRKGRKGFTKKDLPEGGAIGKGKVSEGGQRKGSKPSTLSED